MENSSEVHPQFHDWFERNRSLHVQSCPLNQICQMVGQLESSKQVDLMDIMTDERGFSSRFRDTTEWMTRRLMDSHEGRIGMLPCRARKGNQIWVLLGCDIPLILREWQDKEGF